MPLKRLVPHQPRAMPKGVHFYLGDRSKIVHCIITRSALEKISHSSLGLEQLEPTFHRHRDGIEEVAAHKYDSAAAYYSPLTISPADLVVYERYARNVRPPPLFS